MLGMLQGHRRHRDEPIGVLRHPLGKALVLRSHDPIRQATIRGGVPPETVDGQRLDVHTLLVHHLQALQSEDTGAAAAAHRGQRRALDDVGDGMTQWAWASMTLTGRPPMVTRRRDCAAGLARLRLDSSAPAAPAVAVLRKSLRVCIPRPSSITYGGARLLSFRGERHSDCVRVYHAR
jgi:hypothetical protein